MNSNSNNDANSIETKNYMDNATRQSQPQIEKSTMSLFCSDFAVLSLNLEPVGPIGPVGPVGPVWACGQKAARPAQKC